CTPRPALADRCSLNRCATCQLDAALSDDGAGSYLISVRRAASARTRLRSANEPVLRVRMLITLLRAGAAASPHRGSFSPQPRHPRACHPPAKTIVRRTTPPLSLTAAATTTLAPPAIPQIPAADPADVGTIEGIVNAYYEVINGPPGAP